MKKVKYLVLASAAALSLAAAQSVDVKAEQNTPSTTQAVTRSYNIYFLDADEALKDVPVMKEVGLHTESSNDILLSEDLLALANKHLPSGYELIPNHEEVTSQIGDSSFLNQVEDKYGNQVDGSVVTTGFWVRKTEDLKKTYLIYLLDADLATSNNPSIKEIAVLQHESDIFLLEDELFDLASKGAPQGYEVVSDHNEVISKITDPGLLAEIEAKYSDQVNGSTIITGYWLKAPTLKSTTHVSYVADETMEVGQKSPVENVNGNKVVRVGTKPKTETVQDGGYLIHTLYTYTVDPFTGELTEKITKTREPFVAVGQPIRIPTIEEVEGVVKKAESDPTDENIKAAQDLINTLDEETKSKYQARLDALKKPAKADDSGDNKSSDLNDKKLSTVPSASADSSAVVANELSLIHI